MSGRMSRDKGAAAERELCRLLSDELGVTVRRNVDQARCGGADCLELPGFAIEAKRREVLSRPAWWRQAVTQGLVVGAEPLVFYRQSRKPWRALITGMGGYRDVDWTQALDYIRDKLARLHGIYGERAYAQMPQRPLATRYCCRCLTDKPTKGGRNNGLMFTCAECMESLAKAEGPRE